MKPYALLIGGMLVAALAYPQAQAADSRAKARNQTTKARVAKAAKRPAPPAAAPAPASVQPQGMALSLSTQLRTVPPAPRLAAVPPTSLPPLPWQPTVQAPVVPSTYAPYQGRTYNPAAENPYLPKVSVAPGKVPASPVPDAAEPSYGQTESGGFLASLGQAIPILPGSGQSILPSIKKVYPTGEKPLVVVSFKCPTEALGVTPPTIKLLHNLVDLGMEGINKSDLLSFNLQQVCQ